MRKIIFCIALSLLILAFAQALLKPKYMSGIYEGALIAEYYNEEKNHDVIFIGDCELYENISPVTLWEEYGINSYIRGSAQQLIWQSFYLLEETLNYEKPEVVVFSVLSMKYNEPQNEAYNRLTLDGMRLTGSKLKSVYASMTKKESALSYIFPLLRYHERWKEVSLNDFKYLFKRDNVSHNGFMMRADVKPAGKIPTEPKLKDYSFGDTSYFYLEKLTKMCKDNNIMLILVKAPSLYPYWYSQWDGQMTEFARENGVAYINLLDKAEEIGLDFETDTYDAGLHLNLSGAEKLSKYFGAYLREEFGVKDRREESGLTRIWEQKVKDYNAMKEAQLKEISETGKVQTFTYK